MKNQVSLLRHRSTTRYGGEKKRSSNALSRCLFTTRAAGLLGSHIIPPQTVKDSRPALPVHQAQATLLARAALRTQGHRLGTAVKCILEDTCRAGRLPPKPKHTLQLKTAQLTAPGRPYRTICRRLLCLSRSSRVSGDCLLGVGIHMKRGNSLKARKKGMVIVRVRVRRLTNHTEEISCRGLHAFFVLEIYLIILLFYIV